MIMKGWTKSFPASLIVSVMIFCMFYVSFGIVGPKIAIDLLCKPETLLDFVCTRSYAALRAADLDWIVGPEYSLGRNKQKRYKHFSSVTRGHN